MSDILTGDTEKSTEQPNSYLVEAMGQLSVNSDKNPAQPKNLSDMPIDVVGLIIEKSKFKEQLILRKTSKSLRTLVDNQKPDLTSLAIVKSVFDHDFIKCTYNDGTVVYASPNSKEAKNVYYSKSKKVIVSDDYVKIAFDDLACNLKNPKLKLHLFFAGFVYHRHLYTKLSETFTSVGHQISVKIFNHVELSILPYLKPGVLEKVRVMYSSGGNWDDNTSSETMEEASEEDPQLETLKQVALLDQWKQAEELDLVFTCEFFPMKYAKHFKRFRFEEFRVDDRLLIRIRNYLSKLSNFEHCFILSESPYNVQQLRSEVGDQASPNERTEYVSHYSIPDSDHYLEFMFLKDSIEIRKIKKS